MITFFANLLNQAAEILQWLTGISFGNASPSPVPQQTQRKSFSASVLRADDLLVLTFDFYNLQLDSSKRLTLESTGDAFIIVHFQPQNVAEQAFNESAGLVFAAKINSRDSLQGPPVAARLAGESQLVFYLSPDLLPLEFTLEKILAALSKSAQLIKDRITQPPVTPPDGGFAEFGSLGSQYTAIEAPWRLILSPHPDGRWAHSSQPVKIGTKTELWHTRLGVRPIAGSGSDVDERSTENRTARAVFSPDFAPSVSLPTWRTSEFGLATTTGVFSPTLVAIATGKAVPNKDDLTPFISSLSRYDRHQIVLSTADRTLPGNLPVSVERLMLSSLGSWLQVHGEWDTKLGLVEWRHLSTLGRDQFVRVVEKGFLFPFGNRAVTIKITERKLDMGRQGTLEGKPVAYLRQRKFIVVRQPEKSFTHRAFPFRTIIFKTLITPNLIDPPDEAIALASLEDPSHEDQDKTFWPRYKVAGVKHDVLFKIEGIDWDGNMTSFAAPQIFVPASADSGDDIGKLVEAYNGHVGTFAVVKDSDPRRNITLGGQKIAFAPSQKKGDTTLETEFLILGVLNATGTPHFLPAMRGAMVNHPSLRQISKNAKPLMIRFEQSFLDAPSYTFGNAGEIFAKIDAMTPDAKINFPVEKTGGLVAPDFTPQGLSRSFGAVGDVTAFVGGSFNPGAIFAGIKILGGIPLDMIFMSVPFGSPGQAGETVPGLTTVRTTTDIGGVPVEVFETRYVWDTCDKKLLQPQLIFIPADDAKFRLESVIQTPLDGKPPSFHVEGLLEKFAIVLPPPDKDKKIEALIGAKFDHIRFKAGSNEKVDVSVKFDKIDFLGPLSFVNEIQKYIPLDGFVDPPYLDVNASGVNAGFSLGIPTIGIGIFVLQDISLSAGFHLPFIGGAAGLRFAFCERDHPFLLTVSLFGGGGFFAIDLNTEVVTNVEASLEFGAAIAINLGVAAGQASITGGVYYQKSGDGFNITAFFRATGSLSVLGIITVSVELYVGLAYDSIKGHPKEHPHGGHLYGTASVKVKIKIVFFSTSVSVSIEREFAGSDPTFNMMLTGDDWAEYCNAFAPEAA